jgi:hypothetical protein
VGEFFDGLEFHVSVSYGCAGRGGVNVVDPFWIGHKEAARGCRHHGSTVEYGIRIVWGCADVLDNGLGAGVAVVVWRE